MIAEYKVFLICVLTIAGLIGFGIAMVTAQRADTYAERSSIRDYGLIWAGGIAAVAFAITTL